MFLDSIREAKRTRELERQIERATTGKTTPVIVFQMGKVASSTIEATLHQVPGIDVFRAHRLERAGQTKPEKPGRRLLESWMVHERLIQPRVPAKIVTLVREPIGRNVSAYFQNIDQVLGVTDAWKNLTIEALARGFLEKYNHRRAITWFHAEFKPVLGIDVYEHPFPREEGFQRIQSGPYDALILHVELPDEVKARELARLLGINDLKLVQRNVGEKKEYAEVYQEFLRTLKLPAAYLDEMLGSKYARHFFTDPHLARVRQKWIAVER
jgi:hypothetical protein